jgi:para-aminobenzoate synthetase component 1
LALASCSPETLVDVQPTGRVETWPIKGTRPRGATAEADERARRELLGSAKDRAELLMIVDLERNDLGRICHIGSVETPATAEPRTYPEVHHLVGHVRGQLRPEVGAAGILDAVFPGGSITGAPKLRAIEILETLEPVPRSFFTGSLFWFGDDGTTESSILIRTVVFAGDTALIGAGGGIVADSDPEAEREESNHKIRALAHGLGFDPGEAE